MTVPLTVSEEHLKQMAQEWVRGNSNLSPWHQYGQAILALFADRDAEKDRMAAMGRQGGLKGAHTLNARLSPAQRKASASHAATVRWKLNKKT